MTMIKYRPFLLILACVALAALVWMDNGSSWFGGKSETVASQARNKPGASAVVSKEQHVKTEQASEADIATAEQLLSGNPLASFDKATLDNWVDRPVFAPSRKRPPEQTAQKAAPKPPPPPDYKLLGVVLNSRRTIALLRSKDSGADFRVQVGDMIGGWHVATVERNSVILKRDGETAQTVKFAKDCDDSDDEKCQ
jgi:hypothetical protein